MYSTPFPRLFFLLFKVLFTKVAQHTIRKGPSLSPMFFPSKMAVRTSFDPNVPFIRHMDPIAPFACIYVELLFITCLNITRKGRIYYWNIFGLSLCSVCQDNIGHRLLQKHGWKLGQGLGKSLQGKLFFTYTKKKKGKKNCF